MQVHGPLSPNTILPTYSQLGSPLNKHQKVATEVMLIAGFYCIAKKTAQAVLGGTAKGSLTSATREAAATVTKEVATAAAKEAQKT